jgi:ABC-type transporter Mla subunit MlaD
MRDTIVSLFLISGILMTIFACFWFSGRIGNRFKKVVPVHFPDVSGLKVGDRVDVLGITKGRVAGMRFDQTGGVLVLVALDRDVLLYRNARFAIRSLSYLGSDRYLTVDPGSGQKADDTTVFTGVNEVLNLETTFIRLDQLLQNINPENLIAEFRQTRDQLIRLINLRLAAIDSGFTITSVNIERLTTTIDSLTNLLNYESTARKLLTSPELYQEIIKTTRQMQELITELKKHPEKIFRFRLFR